MKLIFTYLLVLVVSNSLVAQISFEADSMDFMIRTGDKERARYILMPLYEENDEDPVINYYLARVALMDTLYDDAIDYLDVALESDENNTEYLFLLGRAYGFKAQLSGALTAAFAAPKMKNNWEKVLELEPTHLNANWGMFQFYLNAPGIVGGSEEAAFELAKRYANLDPSGGHAMLANYYFFTEKDQVRSEKELLESMNSEPIDGSEQSIRNTNLNTLNQMGYYYLGESDYENSYKYLRWAVRYGPDRVNPYDSMGDHFNAVAQYDSALFYYQSALNINPKFPPSNFNKGQMLEKLGKTEQAADTYRHFIETVPENSYTDRARDRLEEISEN